MRYLLTTVIGVVMLLMIPVYWNELTTDYTEIVLFITVISIPAMLESFPDFFFTKEISTKC